MKFLPSMAKEVILTLVSVGVALWAAPKFKAWADKKQAAK